MKNINSNKKFDYLVKRYGNNHKISYYDFYEKSLNNYHVTRVTLFFAVKNLFLIILSLYSILKFFLFKNKLEANYFIIRKNKDSFVDPRSKLYIKISNLKLRLNFVRSENFFESLKVFFLYPNIVFINSFKYFFNFFVKLKSNNNFYEKINKQNYIHYFILKKIFLILKINKIYLIDDYRIMPLIITICEELGIVSVGYMHGRISSYNMIHKHFSFSKFYLWSSYYKNKLENLNINYKYHKKILINKFIKFPPGLLKNFKIKSSYSQINLLYVIDDVVDDNLLINNFKKIHKFKHINLFIKFRPNNEPSKILLNFCQKNHLKFYYKENVYKIFLENNINFVISSYSTLLIEASLLSIYPLMFVINKKDPLIRELILDKAVVPIYSFNNFYRKILLLKKNKGILKQIKKKIWH